VFGATPSGTVAYVAGQRSDLDVIEVMYTSLHAQAASQMSVERRATAAATQRYRRSFLFGYAERVGQALADVRRVAEATSTPDTGVGAPTPALARIERGRRVDAFVEQRFGTVRSAKGAARAEAGGWREGHLAAEAVDLGRARLGGRRSLGRG